MLKHGEETIAEVCCAAKPIIKRDVIEFLLKTLSSATWKKKSVKIKCFKKSFTEDNLNL